MSTAIAVATDESTPTPTSTSASSLDVEQSNRSFRPSVSAAQCDESGRVYRVYCDGIWDLFHLAHMRQLHQAKHALGEPGKVQLVVGVCSDDTVARYKGSTVMNEALRCEAVRHCRYVDEVMENAPWVITSVSNSISNTIACGSTCPYLPPRCAVFHSCLLTSNVSLCCCCAVVQSFLSAHSIDFVAHDSSPYRDLSGTAPNSDDLYAHLKEADVFIATQRTEGLSSADLISAFLRLVDPQYQLDLSALDTPAAAVVDTRPQQPSQQDWPTTSSTIIKSLPTGEDERDKRDEAADELDRYSRDFGLSKLTSEAHTAFAATAAETFQPGSLHTDESSLFAHNPSTPPHSHVSGGQWETLPQHTNPSLFSAEGHTRPLYYTSPPASSYPTTNTPHSQPLPGQHSTTDSTRLQQLSDAEFAAYNEMKEAHRQASILQQHQQALPTTSPYFPSAVQSVMQQMPRHRKSVSTPAPAPLPLAIQPGIPLPVQSSTSRSSDRLSPRHRTFISVFHRVMAYCEQEKIIPRESVVKKRLLDSKLSIDVDFDDFLAVVVDSGYAVIEGDAPQRVIWPRAEAGGARRFACADFFQPSQRLSTEQTHDLLVFLGQFQPTIDRGRFGFAQWLARHGPKFIQMLPHGVLVELVQLLLNQKVLLFRKGKVSVSPSLNTDPTLIMNALASASYFTGGAEPAGSPTSVSAPTTPPSTPPSQPQWPTSATSSFAHFQQQQQQQQQQQSQHAHHQSQHQQTTSGGRGYGRMTEAQERYDDEHGTEDVDLLDHTTGSVHARHSTGSRRDEVRERMHKNRTWSHPHQFAAAFSSPPPAPQPVQASPSTASMSGLSPLSLFGSGASQMTTSPPASAASTPSITPSSSPFAHSGSGRPRQGSMPPQIPRPPSTQSTASSMSSTTQLQSGDSAIPSRGPSRSSQAFFSFNSATSPSSSQHYNTAAEGSTGLLSPRAVERSSLVQQQHQQQQDYAETHPVAFTSTPTRAISLGGREGQSAQFGSGSGGGSAGSNTVGTNSRRATPHTSPSLTGQVPSFSTRPSSPFEFGLPVSASDSGVGSVFNVALLATDRDSKEGASRERERERDDRNSRVGLPPVPANIDRRGGGDSRLKVARSLNISSPAPGPANSNTNTNTSANPHTNSSSNGHNSPMSHTASLSIISSLASTTSPSVPVTPNSTSFFSSHSPMSQAGGSQPNSADSQHSQSSRFYGETEEGGRPRSASNPVETYVVGLHTGQQPVAGTASSKRAVGGGHHRHHSNSSNASTQQLYDSHLYHPTSSLYHSQDNSRLSSHQHAHSHSHHPQ